MVAARRVGHAPAPKRPSTTRAWIDFRGPPGTIDTRSFSDLIEGHVDPARVRGGSWSWGRRRHAAGRAPDADRLGELMSGPEIEANAIYTATHGLPLRDAPRWIDLLAILALGLLPALASLRLRALLAALLAPGAAVAWLVIAQVGLRPWPRAVGRAPALRARARHGGHHRRRLPAERRRRHSFAVRNEALEEAVHERTPSCARPSWRSSSAWPPRPSRATRRPACTSSASACCASASGWCWA
jgi:hypothetical protein